MDRIDYSPEERVLKQADAENLMEMLRLQYGDGVWEFVKPGTRYSHVDEPPHPEFPNEWEMVAVQRDGEKIVIWCWLADGEYVTRMGDLAEFPEVKNTINKVCMWTCGALAVVGGFLLSTAPAKLPPVHENNSRAIKSPSIPASGIGTPRFEAYRPSVGPVRTDSTMDWFKPLPGDAQPFVVGSSDDPFGTAAPIPPKKEGR